MAASDAAAAVVEDVQASLVRSVNASVEDLRNTVNAEVVGRLSLGDLRKLNKLFEKVKATVSTDTGVESQCTSAHVQTIVDTLKAKWAESPFSSLRSCSREEGPTRIEHMYTAAKEFLGKVIVLGGEKSTAQAINLIMLEKGYTIKRQGPQGDQVPFFGLKEDKLAFARIEYTVNIVKSEKLLRENAVATTSVKRARKQQAMPVKMEPGMPIARPELTQDARDVVARMAPDQRKQHSAYEQYGTQGVVHQLAGREPIEEEHIFFMARAVGNSYGFRLHPGEPPSVSAVHDGSIAKEAGLIQGDKLIEINAKPNPNMKECNEIIQGATRLHCRVMRTVWCCP